MSAATFRENRPPSYAVRTNRFTLLRYLTPYYGANVTHAATLLAYSGSPEYGLRFKRHYFMTI